MNITDTKDKIIKFFRGRLNYLFLMLLSIFEAVNLFVLRFFIIRRFPDGARAFLAVLNSPKIRYNTEFYKQALNIVYVAASFFVGGMIVFALVKGICKLAAGFRLVDREWHAGAVLAVYVIVFGIGWGITGTTEWLCPFAAYVGGLLFLLISGVGLFVKSEN